MEYGGAAAEIARLRAFVRLLYHTHGIFAVVKLIEACIDNRPGRVVLVCIKHVVVCLRAVLGFALETVVVKPDDGVFGLNAGIGLVAVEKTYERIQRRLSLTPIKTVAAHADVCNRIVHADIEQSDAELALGAAGRSKRIPYISEHITIHASLPGGIDQRHGSADTSALKSAKALTPEVYVIPR